MSIPFSIFLFFKQITTLCVFPAVFALPRLNPKAFPIHVIFSTTLPFYNQVINLLHSFQNKKHLQLNKISTNLILNSKLFPTKPNSFKPPPNKTHFLLSTDRRFSPLRTQKHRKHIYIIP